MIDATFLSKEDHTLRFLVSLDEKDLAEENNAQLALSLSQALRDGYAAAQADVEAAQRDGAGGPDSNGEAGELQRKSLILERFVDAAAIEVPQSVIDEETAIVAGGLSQRLKYQAMQTRDYSYLDEDPAQRLERVRAEVAREIKTDLVLEQVIKTEGIAVTTEELEAEAEAMAARQNTPLETVRSFLGQDLALLRKDLLRKKAIDFVCAAETAK